jgi:hypothetical protein
VTVQLEKWGADFSPQERWSANQPGSFPERGVVRAFLRDKSRAPFRRNRDDRALTIIQPD